ncbi:glycine oxidase ThiO [Jannaschia pagri]|uniref:D-amino-acid oxidase n=1 Tax=Jannaschia pagri TaxID=2829797 RepID=A0ABQ4NKK4_9RHOB|nr:MULTISPECIES: FAD-dependent oxidoreductase [unclassified Jannaschia]GIT90800.1 glycine oxidase ThiO [Jannaschia sp. AI_61]GIT94632.1 glycine oxidase ThiO [Jannaschia sp. AI_62]
MKPVTVIGAGVAGLCVATELTARGVPVRIIDRAKPPSPKACSWWAGGMLAPWCERESAEEEVIRFGQEAFGWWQRHTDCVRQEGSLVVALGRDRQELARFGRRTSGYQEVDRATLREMEPDAAAVHGGLFFPDEAHLSPRDALASLVDGLEAAGVVFEEREVATPEPDGPDLTIDCRGLAAKDRLDDLRGVRGEMVVLRCPDVSFRRPIRMLHPRIPIYLVPRGEGVFMLGATMIETSSRAGVTARSLLELLSAAYALNPAFGEAEILEIGVDVRPAFADNLPRIRRKGNVIRANGLYRHGFLLAPSLARMVADLVQHDIQPEFSDDQAYA